MITVFLYSLVCTGIVSVNEVNMSPEVSLFPNPAGELLNIRSSQTVKEVALFDQTGRMVFHQEEPGRENFEVNTSCLSKGMYFVRLRFSDENNVPVVRKVVIE